MGTNRSPYRTWFLAPCSIRAMICWGSSASWGRARRRASMGRVRLGTLSARGELGQACREGALAMRGVVECGRSAEAEFGLPASGWLIPALTMGPSRPWRFMGGMLAWAAGSAAVILSWGWAYSRRVQVSPASGLQDLTQVASKVGAPADAEAVNPIPTAHRRGAENHVQSGWFLLFLAIRRFDRIKAEVTHRQ